MAGFEVSLIGRIHSVPRGLNKLFGFQFKTLYHNGRDHWNLDEEQHAAMSLFPWMFYGLSDLKDPRLHRDALRHLRIYESGFPFIGCLPCDEQAERSHYMRWAGFYEKLLKCTVGRRITTREQLDESLWPYVNRPAPVELTQIASEVFLADFAAKRVLRFSSAG